MKTKLLALFLAGFLCHACQLQRLPRYDAIETGVYGSVIQIRTVTGKSLQGELIEADTTTLVILPKARGKVSDQNRVLSIPLKAVKGYKLTYANGPNYAWAPILYSLATISHGFFLTLTLPVNAAATAVIANSALRYSDRTLRYDYLHRFARYPQGIPPQVVVEQIR